MFSQNKSVKTSSDAAPAAATAPEITDNEWVRLGREVLEIEREGLKSVSDKLDDAFSAALGILAGCKGRVVVTGIGKSGLVGQKIAATLSSTGTPSFFMHPVEGAHGDLGSLRADDVVIAISNSGNTEELNAVLPALQALNLPIIAMTGGMDSRLARAADVTLNSGVPREACALNLAPTASTTAVLALGDALAVCLIRWKNFTESDFLSRHPGGVLGQRLRLKAAAIMRTDKLPVVHPETPIHKALTALDKGRLGIVLVCDDAGCLCGVLTDGDVRRSLCAGKLLPETLVKSAMTLNPKIARADQSAAELVDIMEDKAVTVLPVVDADTRPVGIVHIHDLLGKGQVRYSG